MKIEVIKTYVLFILVGLSIILTYNIWTYQPNFELYDDKGETYVPEVDFYLDGKTVTVNDVVIPTNILFHDEGKHYGFRQSVDEIRLFKDMQTWVLYNFSAGEFTGLPKGNRQVEIRFPTPLPLETMSDFFNFNEKVRNIPTWSFERIFITFEKDQSSMRLHFPSIDGKQQAVATIQQPEKITLLQKYMNKKGNLQEYITFQENSVRPIYLLKDPVQKARRSLSVDVEELNRAPSKLINALFSDPSVVTRNFSKGNIANYTDGRRQMQVGQHRMSMEFTNPSQVDMKDSMKPIELIDKSIENINEHKGWTEEFHLESLDMSEQKVKFLMYNNGVPILGGDDSQIIQEWYKQILFKYKRPLFQISDKIDEEMIELESGLSVVNYLSNQSKYDLDYITDIRVGYDLVYRDISSYIILLEPSWFINYKDSWVKIDMNEEEKEVN